MLTGLISTSVMLVVLWQAPRRRTNQILGLMMLILSVYSALNILARFIPDLGLNPSWVFGSTTTHLMWFVVLMFFFGTEFAEIHTVRTRLIGLALMLFVPV